ncbi:M23 family metallopeptidase [Luteococcus peritonei]|uniref:M23 family metallopeptidase n=1 Tax=Luteococcus peritonei TaxID=88874 RepID=A0ABW4RWF3_9ACTN
MSHTPFRRARAKRVLEVSETNDEFDYESVADTAEVEDSPSVARRGLAALAVSALGLVTVAGVAVAASAGSERVDVSAVSTDKNSADITRAVPAPDAVTIEQQVQNQVAEARKVAGQTNGTLAAFAGRTTITRSAARSELSKAVAAEGAVARQDSLNDVNKEVTAQVTDENADNRQDQIEADQARVRAEAGRIAAEKKKAEAKLKAEGKKAAAAKTPAAQPEAATGDVSAIVSSGGGSAPLPKGRYTVGASWGQYGSWSRWHTGQDFPAPVGTPIYAVADGVAGTTCGGCQGWAGDSALILHHANGGSTLYAHMGRYTVQPGQVVKAGTVIGYVGMKGRTFGPHLHFEYYPKGSTPGDVYKTSNPVTFLLTLGVHV